LDHGTGRDSQEAMPGAIELGNAPPLSVDGGLRRDFDRRRVSVRWLSGTILAGLCGAALMGGAVFAALDGEAHFAANPERVEPSRGALAGRATARKSDRLPPVAETNSARHVIRVTTMTKVGEREVPRVRPFIKISSNLALSATELSAKIPPFNPQRLLANMGDDETPAAEEGAGDPNAEVSFVTRDLLSAMPRLKLAAIVQMDDVLSKVRDAANYTGSVPPKFALASINPGRLAYPSAEAPADPYAGFEAADRAENITCSRRPRPRRPAATAWNERNIPIKKGETLGAILRDLGATPEEIKAIAAVLGPRGRDGNLKDGQKLRVLLSPVRGSQRLQPVRVMLVGETAIEAVAALSDLGKYVAVDVQSMNTVTETADNSDDDDDDDGTGVRLYQSIYETALRNKVPATVIEDMVRIYSYDVDFQRKVQPGDSFDVFFAGEDEGADHRKEPTCCSPRSRSAARPRNTTASRPPTTPWSITTTRPARARRSSWCASPSTTASCDPASAAAAIPSSATSRCIPASTGARLRHADLRLRQRRRREGRLGRRLRQIRQAQAQQRLRDRLRPHVGLRQGPGVGKRVRQGQVIGFVGSTGHVDRLPRPLRNPGQRPLRRSDAHQAAARPLARRTAAGRLREGARPPRRHDEREPLRDAARRYPTSMSRPMTRHRRTDHPRSHSAGYHVQGRFTEFLFPSHRRRTGSASRWSKNSGSRLEAGGRAPADVPPRRGHP
jgi:hypothetical protein